MLIIVLVFLLFLTLYKYLTSRYEFWKKRGVPNPPVSLFFGNIADSLFLKKSLAQLYSQVYDDFPNLRYVGFYKMVEPAIILRDAALIKTMLTTEFSSFHDNDFYMDQKVDPIMSRNPFSMKGAEWRNSRNQLTPCFTLKKLKGMFPLASEVGKRALKYINDSNFKAIEGKELSIKFTTDVVASCIFGIEGNSFVDGKGQLLEMGRSSLTPSKSHALKLVIVFILPFLSSFFKLRMFSEQLLEYFRVVITKSLKYREDHNIVRDDFLDFMRELRLKLGDRLTDDDIIGHAGTMFLDGFETSSIALSFVLFELASNLEAQEKLRKCLDDVLIENNGEFTYENIIRLEYLEYVWKETLRLHPPFGYQTKTCTKDFKLPSPYYGDETSYVEIKKGLPIYVPINAFHRDPQYYPNPEKFIPERYGGENKNALFLSFGHGPRSCLGERFANMQAKTFIAYVISNFEVRLNEKTFVPLQIDPQYFLLKVKNGIWFNFCKRIQ